LAIKSAGRKIPPYKQVQKAKDRAATGRKGLKIIQLGSMNRGPIKDTTEVPSDSRQRHEKGNECSGGKKRWGDRDGWERGVKEESSKKKIVRGSEQKNGIN